MCKLFLTTLFILIGNNNGLDLETHAKNLITSRLIPIMRKMPDYFNMNLDDLRLCRCSLSFGCAGTTHGWIPAILEHNMTDYEKKIFNEVCVTDGNCYQTAQSGLTEHGYGCMDIHEKTKEFHVMLGFESESCKNVTRDGRDEYWICCEDRSFCANETRLLSEESPIDEVVFDTEPKENSLNDGLMGLPTWLTIFLVTIAFLSMIITFSWIFWVGCHGGTMQNVYSILFSKAVNINANETINIDDNDSNLDNDDNASAAASTMSTCVESVEMSNLSRSPVHSGSGGNTSRDMLIKLLNDLETTSGSGSGVPILQERTIAHQIKLEANIGTGRFGDVWLGRWQGEDVAVKIFQSSDEASYMREVMIYETRMLRHPNVLRFIGSDRIDVGYVTEMWLVTEFHPNGSLFDYLAHNVISIKDCYSFIRSSVNGLAFLHSEIVALGNSQKPGIAHRDIKTRNIMVKNDMTCAIGDLGSVMISSEPTDIPPCTKCGTIRYLAPEVLGGKLQSNLFEAYKTADLYSFGLVMWEVLSRTEEEGVTATSVDFTKPYFEHVSRDPTEEEMRDVVYRRALRPEVNPQWRDNEKLKPIVELMLECWSPNPTARLTSLQVRMKMERKQTELKIFPVTPRQPYLFNKRENLNPRPAEVPRIDELDSLEEQEAGDAENEQKKENDPRPVHKRDSCIEEEHNNHQQKSSIMARVSPAKINDELRQRLMDES